MQNHASRRRTNHARSAALLLSAAISSIGAHRAEATSFSATWANATNGTWSTATNWSTNPNFPNNGSPGSTDTYDALIGASGSAYVVTLNSNITINSLTFNAASATLNQTAGTFKAINGLNLQAGTFQLGGGTISSTTITSSGGTLTDAGVGTLSGVTLATGLTINNADNVDLLNNLTLNSTITLNDTNNGASLLAVGAQTISGTGTILFSGTGGSGAINVVKPTTGALTIGPNITIRTSTFSGTVGLSTLTTNSQGTISSETAGTGITLTGAPFSNQGYVQAINGATLTLDGLSNTGSILANASPLTFTGNWSNTGTITATNSAVNFGGTFTPGSIGTFTRSGGTVTINGTVTNTGTTFDLSALAPTTGSILLNAGTINGGTISGGANAATIGLTGNGTLNGVILATPLTITNNQNLDLLNNLTLNSTITLNDTNNGASLLAVGAQTISGTGTILFSGTGGSGAINVVKPTTGALTIGPNITIRTSTFSGTVGLSTLTTNSQGTISSETAGTGITLTGAPFSNQGYVQAINGATLTLDGLSNTGSILANASPLTFTGNWSNTGTITATNSAVNFGGTFTPGSIGTFTRSGGTVTINGTVTNTGTTFDLSALAPTTGSILLNAGTINGGTISGGANAATIGLTGNGTLNAVILATGMTLSNFNTVDLLSGLTLNNTITMNAGQNGAFLNAIGTQTIGGSGIILFAGASPGVTNIVQPTSGALTIGPNITILTSTHGGTVGLSTLTTNNQGTISSETAGSGILLTGAPFNNQGYVQAINGATLTLDGLSNTGSILVNASSMTFTGNWSNSGTITATNSAATFGGTFTPAGIGVFTRSGGTVTINGTVSNAGTTFDLSALAPATGSILLNSGTINGGTVSGGVNSATINLTGNGTFNGVTLATGITMNNFDTVDLLNGLTLNSTITMNAGQNGAFLNAVGTQAIGGTGTILFAGASTGVTDIVQPTSGALTIGPNITIKTSAHGGTVGSSTLATNSQGTISSETAGSGILLTGVPFTNQGYVQAINGATLTLDGLSNTGSILANGSSLAFTGNWSNSGTITATNSAVALGGTFTPAGIGTFIRNGGTVTINGTVSNTGTTLDLSALSPTTGSILLNRGTISGGTISGGVNSATIDVTGVGTLNGVTLTTPMTIDNNTNVFLLNGLTLNSTITLFNVGNAAVLISVGTQTIGGTGTILFGGTSGSGSNIVEPNSASPPLTLGPNITIRTTSEGGTVGNPVAATTNQGTISSETAGAGIRVTGAPFTNQGYVQAINGGTLTLDGLSNTGSILATGTSMSFTGNWSNSGTITATNSAVALGGTFTPAGIGTFIRNGGTVTINGTVNNTGTTFDLSALAATTGSILLSAGTISGGTISGGVNSATIDVTGAGTLNGVTLTTPMTINNSAAIDLLNGLTLNSTITLFNVGNPAVLIGVGTQTIGGTGTILFGGTSGIPNIVEPNTATPLTLGPNITIRTTTDGGNVGNSTQATTNQGTISAQTSGFTIMIEGSAFTNTGTFAASNGGTILVVQPAHLTNLSSLTLTGGHWDAFAGSTINFGTSTITTNAADVRLDGANSHFDAINPVTTNSGTFTVANGRSFTFAGAITNNLGGDIIAAAGGTITIPGGTNNGTIESQAGGTIIFNGSFNHGSTSFLNGAGSVIFNAGTQSFNGTIVGNIDLSLAGAANFGSLSSTITTRPLFLSANASVTAGALLSVGGLNVTGGSSPAIALGAGTKAATLTLTGDVTVANVTGSTQVLSAGSGSNDGVLDLGGAVRTFTINNNNATPDLLIGAMVIDGGITKSGAGAMELTHSNSYSLGTSISNGTLQVSSTNALGNGSVTFQGGALDLRSDGTTTTFANSMFAAPANSMTIHTDRVTNGTAGTFVTGPATLGVNLTTNGNGTLQIPSASLTTNLVLENSNTLEFTGPISGNFGITRGGSGGSTGTAIFSGSQPNTYAGTTTVTRGTLVLNKTAGVMAILSNLQILGGTARLFQSDQINDAGIVTISGGSLDLNGNNENIGGLSGTGGTALISPASILEVAGTYDYTGNVTLAGALICDYSTASPATFLRGQLQNGFAGGSWNGNGIVSPLAAANQGIHRTGIGFAEASSLGIGSFMGRNVDSTTVVLSYALVGDANLDGTVNIADFMQLAQNFGASGKIWSDGDFNYDGVVNALDFNSIATNFGQSMSSPSLDAAPDAPVLGDVVPEPMALAMLPVFGFAAVRRRRDIGR